MTIFHGFWHGPPLGAIRTACLKSFLAKGHRFKLYTYQTHKEAPSGIELEDANIVLPESEIIWHNTDIGPFSDLFRYALLKEEGGWWCDVDTVCLSGSIPEVDEAWSLEWPEIDPNQVGNGQICLRKGSILAKELYQKCLERSRSPLQDRSSLGPHLFSEIVSALNRGKNHNASPAQFYPINWLSCFKLWLPEYRKEIEQKTRNSLFLPIYQSFPAGCGIDLLKLPPEGSYLHNLLATYECINPALPTYEAKAIKDAVKIFLEQGGEARLNNLEKTCGPDVFAELNLKRPGKTIKKRLTTYFARGTNIIKETLRH